MNLTSFASGPFPEEDRPCPQLPENRELLPNLTRRRGGPTKIGELLKASQKKEVEDKLGFDVVEVMPEAWQMPYEYLSHQMPIINPLDFRAIDQWRWKEKIDPSWMMDAMRRTFDRPKGRPARPIPYLLAILKKKKEEGHNLQEPINDPPSYGQNQSLAANRKEYPGESINRMDLKSKKEPGKSGLLSSELEQQADRKGDLFFKEKPTCNTNGKK